MKRGTSVCAYLIFATSASFAQTTIQFTAIQTLPSNQVQLTWSNAALHGYVVEKSSALPWELDSFDQVVPDIGADPGAASFSDSITNVPCRFYRITQGPTRSAIDLWDGRRGTTNDDLLILTGTYSNDWFVQHGFRGNDTLYMSGSAGNDWLQQSGGKGDDAMAASGGTGEDRLFQDGGSGHDALSAGGGDGDDRIVQVGGDGDDVMDASASGGSDGIFVYAGDGDDIIRVDLHEGPDDVVVDAGPGNDRITNTMSWNTIGGTGWVDGGPGTDHLALQYSDVFFKVTDEGGAVLYQTGTDTVWTVSSIEEITYSMGLYIPGWEFDVEENGSKVVEILATASHAGEYLALSKVDGLSWALVSGEGTMSAPDELLHGELSLHPPNGWIGRDYVRIRLTGTWSRAITNTVWVEVAAWE